MGRLYHKEGPMYDKVFYPVLVLRKRVLKPCKTICCVFSTLWSEFKDFIQIKKTVIIDKIESFAFMYWSTLFFVGNHFVDLNSVKDVWCILSNLRQNCMHLFSIWVPCWARLIKLWLNKRIAKHSTKFWC